MSDPVARLAAAERDAAVARERLTMTLGQLQIRLNPRRLARDAAREAGVKSNALAQAGVESARQNPLALAGAVAAAGLFLARYRIAALFRRGQRATPDARSR